MQPPTREERSAEARRLLEGLNGQYVADRMGVSDATVGAWRRGDRVPELGDLLALREATGRALAPQLEAKVLRLLGRSPMTDPDAIEAAFPEAKEAVERVKRRRRKRPPRGASDAQRGANN